MAITVDNLTNNTFEDPSRRAPLITGGLDNDGVTEVVADLAESPSPPKIWWGTKTPKVGLVPFPLPQ